MIILIGSHINSQDIYCFSSLCARGLQKIYCGQALIFGSVISVAEMWIYILSSESQVKKKVKNIERRPDYDFSIVHYPPTQPTP